MPGTRALRGGRQRRRLAESCRRWPCIRRGELPDLVRPGGRGSESRHVLLDRLRPLSLAVSTQRQSVAAMVCSAVDGQILRFGVPRPGPCHGSQAGACRCGRVSASAALVSRGARAFREPSVAGSGLPAAPGPFREGQAVCRTFETGILSLVRIASGSLKGPGRASAFPALQLGRCPAWREGKVFNFGLALGVTGRRVGFFPVTGAVLPASGNPALHRPIGCSQTFSLRAASATVAWPDGAPNTIRATRSAGRTLAGKPTSARVQHDPKITQAERPRPSHNVLLPSNADHDLTTDPPESIAQDRPCKLIEEPEASIGEVLEGVPDC